MSLQSSSEGFAAPDLAMKEAIDNADPRESGSNSAMVPPSTPRASRTSIFDALTPRGPSSTPSRLFGLGNLISAVAQKTAALTGTSLREVLPQKMKMEGDQSRDSEMAPSISKVPPSPQAAHSEHASPPPAAGKSRRQYECVKSSNIYPT